MNKTEIVVSVFCLAYNEEEYIAHALESILSQKTDFRFEILCHDDASTDSTAQIIKKYANKYPDIIRPIFQKDNQIGNGKGMNVLYNYLYPLAKGKYIAYCDGDDYWTDNNKLQKQVDFLENNPSYTLCLHNYYFLYDDSNRLELAPCGRKDKDLSTENMIIWGNHIPQIGAALFYKDLAANRPELYQKIGGTNGSKRFISDMPLYIYLSKVGKVKYFSTPMSVWRRRKKGSWSSDRNIERNVSFQNDLEDFFIKFDNDTNHIYALTIEQKISRIYFDRCYLLSNYRVALKYAKKAKIKASEWFKCLLCSFFPKTIKKVKNKR